MGQSFSATSRESCIMNLSLLARLWISISSVMFCSSGMKMWGVDTPTCGEYKKKKTGCFTKTTPPLTVHSTLKSFWPRTNMAIISLFTGYGDFFVFPKLKVKLKGCCFDNNEDIQMKLQVVLDNLIKMDFQRAFQQWREHWTGASVHKGTTLWVIVTNRSYDKFLLIY